MTDPIAQWGQTIVLRPVKTRLAMGFACTVHDYAGRYVADVRGLIKGWQRLDRFFGYGTPICGYDLDVVAIDEPVPILTFRRVRQGGWWRERPERYEVRRDGVVVGALQHRRSGGFLRGAGHLALESGGHDIGRTRQGATIFELVIDDSRDRTIATITTGHRPASYTLAVPRVDEPTVRALCLAVAIAEYFKERLDHGGALNALSKWFP